MNEVFKYSTILSKVIIFALISAGFMVTAVRAQERSANDKMVLQSVRLSLWYEGAKQDIALQDKLRLPEELSKAMEKHSQEERRHISNF